MTAWGRAGRRDQVLLTVAGDVVLPFVTFLLVALALLHATRRFAASSWLRSALLSLPVFYLFCDYTENLVFTTPTCPWCVRAKTPARTAHRIP